MIRHNLRKSGDSVGNWIYHGSTSGTYKPQVPSIHTDNTHIVYKRSIISYHIISYHIISYHLDLLWRYDMLFAILLMKNEIIRRSEAQCKVK